MKPRIAARPTQIAVRRPRPGESVGRLRLATLLLTAVAATALLGVRPAGAQMKVLNGTYIGNGLAGGQTVTVGFAPDVVIEAAAPVPTHEPTSSSPAAALSAVQ